VKQYVEKRDTKIIDELYRLRVELQKLEKVEQMLDVEAAIAVLEDALNRCRREDMRTPEVLAALDFLEPRVSSKWPFDQFRKSLHRNNEEGRWQNVNASLNAVRLAVQLRI
jgi:hypothetical protein